MRKSLRLFSSNKLFYQRFETFGAVFQSMIRTRAVFKLAVRYCKDHVEEMRADACADTLLDKDATKFWNSVYKISNNKATCHTVSISGATGSQNVCSMWKEHFENLYNSCTESIDFSCVV